MARAALALALALSACAHRPSTSDEPRTQELVVADARFRIRWFPGDEEAAEAVARAVALAAPRVRRWGPLARPVTITVQPTHEALEDAAQRPGYRWLRGWARFDTVDLQSPRTWGWFEGRGRKLEERVAHELAHCAMYQLAGDPYTWMYKEIPRWFAEGIATHTAEQGDGLPGMEALSRYYARERVDPVIDSDPIYRHDSEIVYGAAHHAVGFLLRSRGEERVREILRRMAAGSRFPAAFREAIGVSDVEFAAEFREHVLARHGASGER